MIGVGSFELGVGLLVAALFVYFIFRDRRPVVLISLLVVLSPVLGIFVAVVVAYARSVLFWR